MTDLKQSIELTTFSLFSPFSDFLIHGSFSRHGGVSQGSYESLNLADNVGDDPTHVKNNIRHIRKHIDLPNLVWANQVHGTQVQTIQQVPQNMPECDGFVTAETDITLMIKHADCQAAIFFDPKKRVIGAAHSGWRGSIQNIYSNIIKTFYAKFNSDPKDILVGISPSLGPCHAEFKNFEKEIPRSLHKYHIGNKHFDFWKMSQDQLISLGVLEQHIEIAGICTYANPQDYFSYRRDSVTGRNATIIGIRKD